MASSFLWVVLHKLWDFTPILAPTIAIYLIDAPISLKVWIGAQHAPQGPDNAELPERKGRLAKLRLFCPPWPTNLESAVLGLFLTVVCFVDIFVKDDSTWKKFILYGILVLPGTYCVSRLPWRPVNLLVFRMKGGVPLFTQRKESKSVVVDLLDGLAGWAITSAALLCGSVTVVQRLCAAILYGSFLHVFMLGSVPAAVKERNLRSRFIYGGIVGFVCVVVIIAIGYFGNSTKKSESPDVPSSDPTPKGRFSVTWANQAVSLIWSSFCFELIALCHRMDYSFARESGQIGAPIFRRPENTCPPNAPPPNKIQAIRILASFQPVFCKPYYHASIAGIVSTAVGLTCLITSADRTGSIIASGMFGYYLNMTGAPVICLFIMALAYWRGEVRKVWAYGERWMDVPEGVPQVIDEDKLTAPELEFYDKEKKGGGEEMSLNV